MKLINVKEMAVKLSSTVGTVYAYVSMRVIPAECIIKLGRSLRFDETAVNMWLNTLRQAPLPSIP